MPSMRQRLTTVTLSLAAVLAVGLAGSGSASALDVDGRVCTDGSARLDVGGTQLRVGRGAQDDCVRFVVEG